MQHSLQAGRNDRRPIRGRRRERSDVVRGALIGTRVEEVGG